eukprot:11073638-Alexandrium_andersonii.AAC.1
MLFGGPHSTFCACMCACMCDRLRVRHAVSWRRPRGRAIRLRHCEGHREKPILSQKRLNKKTSGGAFVGATNHIARASVGATSSGPAWS